MIVVQWNKDKVTREQLEDEGWQFIRYVGDHWIEMSLGKE